ncbi:hypothetical protein [Thermosediminibacter oceani]|uniref:Uncharacterized protein n=1 Tax=Thermosediminibacter oceani (strain ATCC BAA-1034 / DSM 16646 / JW/IW-1228P) TaxID=555079 RepID=D9S1Y3_THEOJ|nr:hypothetical protein [Thermosediminibacter oceani]ADL07410.1 hypothetical protein Toce_0638 [Thermosediminibacter oceani DSM 16646]
MAKEELENAFKEPEEQESLIKNEESEATQTPENEPVSFTTVGKKLLRQAITTGNLKEALDKISNSIDLTKCAVECFTQITEKAQMKLEGKTLEFTDRGGTVQPTDKWVPMFLSLMKTEEFQHLMANFLYTIVK